MLCASMRRAGAALLFVSAVCVPRILRRSVRATPSEERPALEAAPRRLLEAEPYKIAIAAFYALCVQRIFETSIASLEASAPTITISSSTLEIHATSQQVVLLCQVLALLIWLGLYYINNVRLYLLVPDDAPLRRALAHIVLTAALSEFYFLAATTGRPSTNQLLLILAIVATDTVFPLIIGPVLSVKYRVLWVIRGILQTAGVLCILLFVSPSDYGRIAWSAGWLALMLVQLIVVVPAERRWRGREALGQQSLAS